LLSGGAVRASKGEIAVEIEALTPEESSFVSLLTTFLEVFSLFSADTSLGVAAGNSGLHLLSPESGNVESQK
jgi:hypothetical protein